MLGLALADMIQLWPEVSVFQWNDACVDCVARELREVLPRNKLFEKKISAAARKSPTLERLHPRPRLLSKILVSLFTSNSTRVGFENYLTVSHRTLLSRGPLSRGPPLPRPRLNSRIKFPSSRRWEESKESTR